jgi:hypothetical protein
MFDRISNGFSLARSSWAVLVKDKHLIVFPIVSGFLFLLVLASFAVPLATLVDWNRPSGFMLYRSRFTSAPTS